MKKKKNIPEYLLLLIVLFLALSVTGANAESRDIILQEKKSVVTIFISDRSGVHVASGSGFVADEGGMIATSCRLLSKWLEKVEYSLSVELEGGGMYPVDYVISNNCKNNLAMIKIRASGLPPVRLAAGHKPKTGDRIVILSGSSVVRGGAVSGVIKAVRESDGIFQTDIGITAERDGSPVFNLNGEVTGIATLQNKGKTKHMIIPSRYILMEQNKCRNLIRETREVASTSVSFVPSPPVPGLTKSDRGARPPEMETRNAEQEFLAAYSYERSGMYAEAVEAYMRALSLKPDYLDAYVNLGLIYYKLERYSEAVEAYKEAVRIKPDTPTIYNKLAAVYIIVGEYSSALEAFRASIKIDPSNYETHFNLGVTYLIAGDKDGAINEYFILKDRDNNRAEKLLDLIF